MNSNNNSNNSSPSRSRREADNNDDELVQNHATSSHHSQERIFEEGDHHSVHAEEILPESGKEVDTKPRTKDSTSVISVTDDAPMRRQLSFAIAKLTHGEDIILKGYGSNISKVVRMAEILK